MKNSALRIEKESTFVAPPLQDREVAKIITYPSAAATWVLPAKDQRARWRRRREKSYRFVVREAVALCALIFFLVGLHTRSVIELGLSSAFVAGVVIACLAVVGIPVIFYGLPGEKYRYRARRS